MSTKYDAVILGAGAAGLMCAIAAGRRGRTVVLIDHAVKAGGKIPLSGGGHCNFSNVGVSPRQYVSNNPHFCKSALSRYGVGDFSGLLKEHGISFHERKLGQLFCDGPAQQIADLLKSECDRTGARFELGCKIERVSNSAETGFRVETRAGARSGAVTGDSLVVATGGLSLPQRGATGIGFEIARQYGLKVVEPAPALDGFVVGESEASLFRALAGISLDAVVTCGGQAFPEKLLFTHQGLSGPAALQASLYWTAGAPVLIDLVPDVDCFAWFQRKKKEGNRGLVKNLLGELLPSRLAEHLCARHFPSQLPLPQVSEKSLEAFCRLLRGWTVVPVGTVGYVKAEVTRGGVDTDELSSKSMEARMCRGLYFVGEVVDVTGWLGGYNLHWAWASGWAAGQYV